MVQNYHIFFLIYRSIVSNNIKVNADQWESNPIFKKPFFVSPQENSSRFAEDGLSCDHNLARLRELATLLLTVTLFAFI